MDKTILVCDDDEGILDVVSMILAEDHYKVVTENNGNKVLIKAKLHKPDLILLDLWIPGTSGEKIIRLLKEDPITTDIPVIIFSASRDIAKVAADVNADDYLPKPFNLEILESMVKKYLK